jgi:hypothetical protein
LALSGFMKKMVLKKLKNKHYRILFQSWKLILSFIDLPYKRKNIFVIQYLSLPEGSTIATAIWAEDHILIYSKS